MINQNPAPAGARPITPASDVPSHVVNDVHGRLGGPQAPGPRLRGQRVLDHESGARPFKWARGGRSVVRRTQRSLAAGPCAATVTGPFTCS